MLGTELRFSFCRLHRIFKCHFKDAGDGTRASPLTSQRPRDRPLLFLGRSLSTQDQGTWSDPSGKATTLEPRPAEPQTPQPWLSLASPLHPFVCPLLYGVFQCPPVRNTTQQPGCTPRQHAEDTAPVSPTVPTEGHRSAAFPTPSGTRELPSPLCLTRPTDLLGCQKVGARPGACEGGGRGGGGAVPGPGAPLPPDSFHDVRGAKISVRVGAGEGGRNYRSKYIYLCPSHRK